MWYIPHSTVVCIVSRDWKPVRFCLQGHYKSRVDEGKREDINVILEFPDNSIRALGRGQTKFQNDHTSRLLQ